MLARTDLSKYCTIIHHFGQNLRGDSSVILTDWFIIKARKFLLF